MKGGLKMNLQFDILKLSIIFMLVLVLIPVATAMDSNETFYVEYEDSNYEDLIDDPVEYEIEDIQSHEPSHEENVKTSDTFNEDAGEDSHNSDSNNLNHNEIVNVSQNSATVEKKEYVGVHDKEVINSEFANMDVEFSDDLTRNINESGEDDLTFENSVNQDFLIYKNNLQINFLLFNDLYNESSFSEVSFNNYDLFITKILKLKDKLLFNQGTFIYFHNQIVDFEEIIAINKITSDYAYNIDNSIVGAEGIVNLFACFLNFKSFFDAFFLNFYGDIFQVLIL